MQAPTDVIDIAVEAAELEVVRLATFRRHEEASGIELPSLRRQFREEALRLGLPLSDLEKVEGTLEEMAETTNNMCAHCLRVGIMSTSVSGDIGADPVQTLLISATHDIGKAALPLDVLQDSVADMGEWGPDSRNRKEINSHTEDGARMAVEAGFGEQVALGILYHHCLQTYEPVGEISDVELGQRPNIAGVRMPDLVDASARNSRHLSSVKVGADEYLISEVEHALRAGCNIDPRNQPSMAADIVRKLQVSRAAIMAAIAADLRAA